MKRTVIYSKQAAKKLGRMPASEADRIRQKIVQYAEDPASLANNVKKLEGVEYYRLRVGDWRRPACKVAPAATCRAARRGAGECRDPHHRAPP